MKNVKKDQIIIKGQKFNKMFETEVFDIMARKDVLTVMPFGHEQNRLFFVLTDGQEEYYYNEAEQESPLGDWEAYITNFKDKDCFDRDDYNSFPLDLFWTTKDVDPFEFWENFKILAKQYLELEYEKR